MQRVMNWLYLISNPDLCVFVMLSYIFITISDESVQDLAEELVQLGLISEVGVCVFNHLCGCACIMTTDT